MNQRHLPYFFTIFIFLFFSIPFNAYYIHVPVCLGMFVWHMVMTHVMSLAILFLFLHYWKHVHTAIYEHWSRNRFERKERKSSSNKYIKKKKKYKDEFVFLFEKLEKKNKNKLKNVYFSLK